jgi:hypothetical protein
MSMYARACEYLLVRCYIVGFEDFHLTFASA